MKPEPPDATPDARDDIDAFRDALLDDIRRNRIILPSLPDIVLRIRDAVSDPKADAGKIARIVNTDPSISARIVKIANSALYRRQNSAATDLRVAVARIGNTLIKTLVTNLSILQVMHSPAGSMKTHLERLFKHCAEVAAMSYALARSGGRIDPESAMLAGIVHDIGSLPILQKASSTKALRDDEARLDRLLSALHPEIGAFVLESWSFPPQLIEVARDHEKLFRGHDGEADLVDIVIVADLSLPDRTKRGSYPLVLANVSAFSRLGIDPQTDPRNTNGIMDDFDEMLRLLGR
jgi:putative nucleotidyltransferase with HDIG domain